MSSLSEDLLKTDRFTTMIAKGEWIVHGYDKLHINVLLIIILGVSIFMPFFRQKRLETMRLGLMRKIQKDRGSRVITLIHRQESLSFLGIPLSRYINIEDSSRCLSNSHDC